MHAPRYEFPFFQHLAAKYEGRVAFLGVDAKDSSKDAAASLRKFPVPYPHYEDPSAYAAQHVLDSDIQRYAIHGRHA
jgi:thiol-disulfide isomerase/thioredoxin